MAIDSPQQDSESGDFFLDAGLHLVGKIGSFEKMRGSLVGLTGVFRVPRRPPLVLRAESDVAEGNGQVQLRKDEPVLGIFVVVRQFLVLFAQVLSHELDVSRPVTERATENPVSTNGSPVNWPAKTGKQLL